MTVSTDVSSFAVDGIVPGEVASPTSLDELAALLRDCDLAGKSVVPHAGQTRISVGNIASDFDVALDLSAMPSEFEHEPGDMTVVCDANVNIGALEEALNAEGQRLPFRVPQMHRATVGGSVASNAGGRLRPRFGGIRDWIIGLHVVSPSGVFTKSGGRVVKNVQGFELHRLHTGAYGTLGIITSAAFKLVPLPRASSTVAIWFDDFESAAQATNLIAGRGFELDSLRVYAGIAGDSVVRDLAVDDPTMESLADEAPTFLILTKVAGSPASVRSQVEDLRGLAGTVPNLGYQLISSSDDDEVWDYLDASASSGEFVIQCSGLPSDAARLMRRLQSILAQSDLGSDGNFALDGGYGTLTMSIDSLRATDASQIVAALTSAVGAHNCTYLIESCPPHIKSDLDVFGIDSALEQIMQRTKLQFDPNRTLNPCRFAFRI